MIRRWTRIAACRVRALVANLPRHIVERERRTIAQETGWDKSSFTIDEEPRFPTSDDDMVTGWERTFRHKRRHLVWLFQTAVRLGEEVVYSMI